MGSSQWAVVAAPRVGLYASFANTAGWWLRLSAGYGVGQGSRSLIDSSSTQSALVFGGSALFTFLPSERWWIGFGPSGLGAIVPSRDSNALYGFVSELGGTF